MPEDAADKRPPDSGDDSPGKTGGDGAKPRRSRPRRRIAWGWIVGPLVVFLLLSGLILLTDKPSATTTMEQATKSFSKVQRGDFRFVMTVTPSGDGAEPSVFELSGPFELVPGKPLPKAKITYSVGSGGQTQDVTLLMTGDDAYSLLRGQAYELPKSVLKELKQATKDLNKSGGGGLSGIKMNFDKWLVDPKVSNGGRIDDTPTWRTDADVNVVNAVKDLVAAAGQLGPVTGQKLPELSDKNVKQIEEGIKDASVTVFVGRWDGILRQMDMAMDFRAPEGATAATGGIDGGRMHILLGISEPNRPVRVSKPKNPLPYSALESLAEGAASQSGTALDDGLGQ